jgi:hypothetical protein
MALVLVRILDLAGPVLCGLAGVCMLLAALAVDLDSGAARALMAAAAILFVPGALLTLVYVRRYYGPGR